MAAVSQLDVYMLEESVSSVYYSWSCV